MLSIEKHIATIGIDIGGTKILGGVVHDNKIIKTHKSLVPKGGAESDVIDVLCKTIETLVDHSIEGIGIGVPSVVDVEKGIVYDVQNIPSWKEVHLKDRLEKRFNIPVCVNNDANCFALGEKYFGIGKSYKDIVALIVGTGLAAGIIIDDKLYKGFNCGAGEFGMIPYLDHNYEYYSCGQFFENIHHVNGANVFELAMKGDKKALEMFEDMGTHLGNAITTILFAYDPEIIILGGSVSRAYPLFKDALWKSLESFAYQPIIDKLTIEISNQKDIAVLGAAALYYHSIQAQSTSSIT